MKIDCETAIAKIKIRLDSYYSKIGRKEIDENEIQDLIEDIDEIISKTKYNKRKVIIEGL